MAKTPFRVNLDNTQVTLMFSFKSVNCVLILSSSGNSVAVWWGYKCTTPGGEGQISDSTDTDTGS